MAPSSNKLSPYAEGLKNYLATLPGTPSEADIRNAERTWMYWRLSKPQCDFFTIKTGQPVHDFVTFEDLDPSKYPQHDIAYAEARANRIPNLEEFYKLFAVMCHLNDKGSDPDKLCAPRHKRLDAIAHELHNPGTMQAPEGFASDNKAGWTHEVKHGWRLLEDGFVAKKVGENKYTVVAPLEQAYITVAHAHVKTVSGQIKHSGRDVTQKNVREHDSTFPTQIIKDFVAACPGCNASPKRVARYNGTVTTRTNGGNRGQKQKKQLSTTPPIKRSHSELLDNDNNDYAHERAAKKPRISSTKVALPAQGSIMRNNLYPTAYHGSPESGYPVQPYNITRPTDFGHPVQMNQEFNLPQGDIFGANNHPPCNRSTQLSNSMLAQPTYSTEPTYGNTEKQGNNDNSLEHVYNYNLNNCIPIIPTFNRTIVQGCSQNSEDYMQQVLAANSDMVDSKLVESLSSQQVPVQFPHDTRVQGFGSTEANYNNLPESPTFYQPMDNSSISNKESSSLPNDQELIQHRRTIDTGLTAFIQQDSPQEHSPEDLFNELVDFDDRYANTDETFHDGENYAFDYRAPTPELPQEETATFEVSEEVKPKEQLREQTPGQQQDTKEAICTCKPMHKPSTTLTLPK